MPFESDLTTALGTTSGTFAGASVRKADWDLFKAAQIAMGRALDGIGAHFVSVRGIASGTSLPNNSPTRILFVTQDDTEDNYANGFYTARTTGIYLVHGTVTVPGQASGFSSSVSLYRSGVEFRRGDVLGGTTFSGTRMHQVRELVRLTAAQTISIMLTQTSGATITVAGTDNGDDRWGMEVVRIR